MGGNKSIHSAAAGSMGRAGDGGAALPRAPRDEVPDMALDGLCDQYSCEVLRSTKGIVRGCFGTFQAQAFYRRLPGDDLTSLRHALIIAMGIESFAAKVGEAIAGVERLGEGSYATVYGGRGVAVKVISDRERPWVHEAAVRNAVAADRIGVGPCVFGHGRIEQLIGGHLSGTALVMERLDALGELGDADECAIMDEVALVSSIGFHNDVKLPNTLRREGRPTLIDFDLMEPWAIKVAVTSNCIEYDFRRWLEPAGSDVASTFREYCTLFSFSLTVEDCSFYRRVLRRLSELWCALEGSVLSKLASEVDHVTLEEIPFEVLIRAPLEGISVCLLDLRGNLYVHLRGDLEGRACRLETCRHLPQLKASVGPYWP